MTKEELDDEKRKLIEHLGVQLERENYAPVAARIFATLILTGGEGITFDELVTDLCASKSSISTHLDHLQTSNKVKYFTKPGDRKRYFIINPNLMFNVIDEMMVKWETEKEIHQNVLQYKKKRNELNKNNEEYEFDLEFQENFLTFLEEATAAIQKLKKNIINKSNQQNLQNR